MAFSEHTSAARYKDSRLAEGYTQVTGDPRLSEPVNSRFRRIVGLSTSLRR
jgi:hypothetical protein